MTGPQPNFEKGFFLIRMNSQNALPGFMTTSYLGVLEDVTDEAIVLRDVCQLLEQAKQGKGQHGEPVLTIDLQYYTNSMVSNDTVRFPKTSIAFSRDVSDKDELLKGYHSAFEALRLDKVNLQRASNLHGVAPVGRA